MKLQSIELGNSVTLDMVYIPSGTFRMGSPEDEKDRDDDEAHQHLVTVPEFYMGKYPVTQAQYEAVMKENPSRFKTYFKDKDKNKPIESIYWQEAFDFCQKISLRLPSEAQWEYACRAGTTTPFYFGETITTDLANYNSPYKGTTDVGQFPPNAFGLYDMHGNVWEWCQDAWHDNYQGAPTDGSAWENGSEERRVLRGGSWNTDSDHLRSSFRNWDDSVVRSYGSTGLRVVLPIRR